jgi:hypothetical protein
MSLIHLALAANETEAEIICSLLRSEHIACRLQTEPFADGLRRHRADRIPVARADLTRALDLIGNGGS